MTNKQLAEFNAMKTVVIKLSNVVESLLMDIESLQDKIKASELISHAFLGDNSKKHEAVIGE